MLSLSDMCGFDSNLCEFEADPDVWVRQRGTKTHVDHTYGTDNGEYGVNSPECQQHSPEHSGGCKSAVRRGNGVVV